MQNDVALSEGYLAADFADQVAGLFPLPEKEYPVLVSVSIPAFSPLRWLAAQRRYPQWYWQDRSGRIEVAGCGSLLTIQDEHQASFALEAVAKVLDSHPQSHLFTFLGGSAFHMAEKKSLEWADFPQAGFSQPEVVMLREGEEHRLIIGTLAAGGEPPAKVTRRLARLLQKSLRPHTLKAAEPLQLIERTDLPDRAEWDARFRALMDQLAEKKFEKAVVARRSELMLSGAAKPLDLLGRLQKRDELSYSFMYAPTPASWFASKSPECLLRFTPDRLECDALGGTARMSELPAEEQQGADYLRNSSKISNEHRFVVEDVRRKMTVLADSFLVSESPELVQLSHVQHLRSRLAGVPRAGLPLAEAVLTLHPTAAVCGYPQANALRAIAEFEPFSRGWYAGPVGLIRSGSAELAVALRCMLGHGRSVVLFGGAGIVEGSTAEGEWDEIENKLFSAVELFDRLD